MASTKFYLDLRGKAKDGKGSILISLFHNGTTTTIPTGVRVSRNEWNNESRSVIKIVGAEAINADLQEQKAKIDRAIALLSLDDSFSRMTASDLKREITGGKPKKLKKHPVSELFREYIDTGNLKDGTKEIYRLTWKKVLSYSGSNLQIEDVNYSWLRGFEQYLAKTQSINGRSIYLRAFRAVCNYARHSNIQFQYPFQNFQIKSEPTKKRCVSVDVLRKLKDYPTTSQNEMYRDYFFLMFYLIGINAKDLLLARKSQVINGRLEYIREKTRKKYSIKIEPEAEELLNRYCGKGDYLLEAMDHCKHYKSFAREINDALKTIGDTVVERTDDSTDLFASPVEKIKIIPVIPEITTYFSRHCWATFAYEIGIQTDIISQALGHSFGNKTTLIYIKPDQTKVDEANRKVIDYLLG